MTVSSLQDAILGCCDGTIAFVLVNKTAGLSPSRFVLIGLHGEAAQSAVYFSPFSTLPPALFNDSGCGMAMTL